MREDELVTEVRVAAQLPDDFVDYPAARIRVELTNVLQNEIAPALAAARVGISLQRRDITLIAGRAVTHLPPRAMSAGFECLDLTDGSNHWPLIEVAASQAWQYESTSVGRPRFYCVLSAGVKLYPTPDRAYTLRTQFYARPSAIVEKQVNNLVGEVIEVDYTQRRIGLTGTIVSIIDKTSGGPISSVRPLDVIAFDNIVATAYAPMGTTYDYALHTATWTTLAAQIIQVDAGFDLSLVKQGDYVRAAGQSEWPLIPHEHHILLVHATAAKICRDRGMHNAAGEQQSAFQAGMAKLKDGIQPRVKASAQTIVPRAHMLRRGGLF